MLFCLFVQTDPFNRSHLTADMLIPDDALKARIEEFVRSQEMKKHLSLQSTKATIQTTNGETMLVDQENILSSLSCRMKYGFVPCA